MPSTLAKPAYGFLLQMADSSGSNFGTIAEVKDIQMDMSAQVEDVTAHSNATAWRTRITTLLSFGPVTFPINWAPADSSHNSTTGILAVFKGRLERNFRLVDPDLGVLVTFAAVISDMKGGLPVAGVKSASVTLQGSGAPTFAI